MAFAYTCHIDTTDQDEEGGEGGTEGANAGAGGVEGAELAEQQRERRRRRRRRRSRVAVRRLRIFTCQFNKSMEVSRVQASLELEPTLMMLAFKVCYEVQEVDILESQELVS